MTVRMKLTERERELVEAFRTERAIYNSALADVLVALEQSGLGDEGLYKAIAPFVLALRRVD